MALAATAHAQEQEELPTSRCIECHVTLEGALSKAVEDWRISSHAKHGIGCEGCHRGDPDDDKLAKAPSTGFVGVPRIREVPYFCGRCHAEITEKHLASPHGEHGLPNCVTCHGSHAVVTPAPDRIITEETCTKCHGFDAARSAQQSLNEARRLLDELEGFSKRVVHIPAVRDHVEEVVREMNIDREGVISTFHSFQIGEIERIGMNVERLRKTIQRLYERETMREENIRRERPIILILMGFFVFATILGFSVYRHTGEVEPGK